MTTQGREVGRRTMAAAVACALAGLLIVACGGSTPTPTSPGVGDVTPVLVANTPPTIESIAVSTDRTEVDTEVTVSATVRDAETPIDQLTFDWRADGGTFTGTGASVKWRAPKDQPTPRDYTFTLTVVETYGALDATGARPQNAANANGGLVRVHNSPKELGDMSVAFLSDFANSSVPSGTCLRDFTDNCQGKLDERHDIDVNRVKFLILGSSLSLKSVTIAANQSSANIVVGCSFTSKRLKCLQDDPPDCTVGAVGSVGGNCLLTGRYEQKRWLLCDSNFNSTGPITSLMRAFFGIR